MRPIDYFETAVREHSGKTALVDGDVSWTFRQLSDVVSTLGLTLTQSGHRGGCIAIYSPNSYWVIVCTLAAMKAGVPIAPVHAGAGMSHTEQYLGRVKPTLVFYDSRLGAPVEQLRARVANTTWICMDRDLESWLNQDLPSAERRAEDWGNIHGNPSDLVYIRQTSGSTGAPKLVQIDVDAFNASHRVLRNALSENIESPVCLVAAPLSHAAGTHAFCMLSTGATLVIARDFCAGDVLASIEHYSVSHMFLPATALYSLLDCSIAADTSTLRSVLISASSIAPHRLVEAVNRFGPCICVCYGQIEGGFLTWLDSETLAKATIGQHKQRLGSSGRSLYVARLAVMNDVGQLLEDGHTGEIVVRGRSVRPYCDDPEETNKAQRFGWHHTGDIGYFDSDGFLYIVGRKKDIVISGGFKISPSVVEHVILECVSVSECAVVGVPHPKWGECLVAALTALPGHVVDVGELSSLCRSKLGAISTPKLFDLWSELPKTPVGKIDKLAIRRHFASRPPLPG